MKQGAPTSGLSLRLPAVQGMKSFASIIVMVFFCFNIVFHAADYKDRMRVVAADIINYYNYLPAVFKHHSLAFEELPLRNGYIVNNEGRAVQKMTMGMAFLYLPFFQAGHAWVLVTGQEMDEYAPPFTTLLCLSAVVYLALGLFALRKLLLKYWTDTVTALVLITLTLGTNLFYYTVFEGPMPHVHDFALISVFLWLTIRWHKSPRPRTAVALGLVAGLITLIRPSNAVLLLFPILFWCHNGQFFKAKLDVLRKKYHHILLIAVLALLVWAPQMAYWKYATGSWLYFSYGDEGFFFDSPMIHAGFFSFRNGWLLYAPVMIFALAGFYVLRKHAEFLLPSLITFLVSIYIIFSWWCWWYVGFGLRAMIELYPLLALPLAALLTKVLQSRKWLRAAVFSIWGLMIIFGLFKTWQYRVGKLHFDGMTKEAYRESLFSFGHCTTEYYQMLRSPDYEAAVKGEQRW
jgi:hypothetical protein